VPIVPVQVRFLRRCLVGCAGNEPHPRIDAVDPAQAYTDRNIWLTLTGQTSSRRSVSTLVRRTRGPMEASPAASVASRTGTAHLFRLIGPTQISVACSKRTPKTCPSFPATWRLRIHAAA